MRTRKLDEDFFSRSAKEVARDLLGKVLVRKIGNKELKGRIVETEAYFDENDPASRAAQNGDLRKTMLMKSGTILVYGVHNNWLVNFVTGEEGRAEAVLLRAIEPLNFEGNTRGPGLLTKALELGKDFHKKNIFEHQDIWFEDERNTLNSEEVVESFRIGVSNDLPKKLRFYIKGSDFVSRK